MAKSREAIAAAHAPIQPATKPEKQTGDADAIRAGIKELGDDRTRDGNKALKTWIAETYPHLKEKAWKPAFGTAIISVRKSLDRKAGILPSASKPQHKQADTTYEEPKFSEVKEALKLADGMGGILAVAKLLHSLEEIQDKYGSLKRFSFLLYRGVEDEAAHAEAAKLLEPVKPVEPEAEKEEEPTI
ncbi:MAG: hypothetical protein C0467_14130 [Planctomycetaceae bacterium]|nr:hypothetical protein [Planctomycetaceae bacterium]